MIGDAWTDIQAGQSAGVRGTIILKTGRGTDQLTLPIPDDVADFLVCDNLLQAIEIILEKDS